MVNASQSYASSGAGNNFFNQQKARANSANLANNNFIRLGAMSYNASQDPYSQSLNQPLNNGNANSLADNQFISKFGNMQQNATNSANARYDMNALSPLYNVGRGNYTSTYQNLQPLASQAMTPRERMYAMGDWAMGTLQAEKDMMNQNMLNKWNATMAHNLIGDREKAYQNDFANSQDYAKYANDALYRNAMIQAERAKQAQNQSQWEQEQAYQQGVDTLRYLDTQKIEQVKLQQAQERAKQQAQQAYAQRYAELRKKGDTHEQAVENLNSIFGNIL